MFRKQDFKKVDLLGSGKKNTKIYKAEHIPTGKYYAIKEVEAKTLDKLNEYKVRIEPPVFHYQDLLFALYLHLLLLIFIGGSSAIVQSSKSSKRTPILRLLFLRDYVQYVPNCDGLWVHGQPDELRTHVPQAQECRIILAAGRSGENDCQCDFYDELFAIGGNLP